MIIFFSHVHSFIQHGKSLVHAGWVEGRSRGTSFADGAIISVVNSLQNAEEARTVLYTIKVPLFYSRRFRKKKENKLRTY